MLLSLRLHLTAAVNTLLTHIICLAAAATQTYTPWWHCVLLHAAVAAVVVALGGRWWPTGASLPAAAAWCHHTAQAAAQGLSGLGGETAASNALCQHLVPFFFVWFVQWRPASVLVVPPGMHQATAGSASCSCEHARAWLCVWDLVWKLACVEDASMDNAWRAAHVHHLIAVCCWLCSCRDAVHGLPGIACAVEHLQHLCAAGGP